MSKTARRLGQLRHGPGGGLYRIIATADSTHNTFFGIEDIEPPGGGTPLHLHTREDEFFHVVEGQLTLWVDGKTITLGPGQSFFAPRNIPHAFKNCTASPIKFLIFCSPPDIEPFFDFGLPTPTGDAPAPEQMIQNARKLGPQFGIQLMGPCPL